VIEDQRLPSDHVGEAGRLRISLLGALAFPSSFGWLRADLGLLVPTQLLLDVLERPAASAPPCVAMDPAPNAVPRCVGLLEHVVEEIADILGDRLHHAEDLFEHVSHQSVQDPLLSMPSPVPVVARVGLLPTSTLAAAVPPLMV